MATTTILYKAITLQPGEQFTLPPGGELISAESPSDIETTCDIGELEDLECYVFVFGNAEDDGNQAQIFESNNAANVPVKGIKFNGVNIPFTAPFAANSSGIYNLPDIITAINSTSAGTVIYSASGAYNYQGDRGVISYITFKAIPSVVKNLQLWMYTYNTQTSFGTGFLDGETIDFFISPTDYADVSTWPNVPTCS